MKHHLKLQLATEDDNERLIRYFEQSTIPGELRLRQRRMTNFFNQYRLQSDDIETYMLINEQDDIEALATLLFREAIVDGTRQTIGYATDLRVSPTRRAVLSWSQHFLPVVEKARKQRDCRFFFSVVAATQRQAYNAFIRPRTFRRRLPRYHLFRRLNLVSLHGLWPFHAAPLPGIRIRSATTNDIGALADYLIKKTSAQPVRYFEAADDFVKSLERWHDLDIGQFLLAFDKNDKLIGCVAPWSSERVQRVYVASYGPKAKNMQDLTRVLSWMGVAHAMPPEDGELEIRYLTHLHADNPDIFYSLLYHAYRNAGRKEVLVYAHFDYELTTLPPRSFLSAQMPFGLYCILSPLDPIPEFLRPKMVDVSPTFEPAFI